MNAELPSTMLAALRREYGGPEVVTVETVAVPVPAPDRVLVRVEVAGLDRGVLHIMEAHPALVRVMGFGLRRPKQPVLGTECAGVVVAVGRDVTALAVGDEVFGAVDGAFAEYAVARPRSLARRPAGLGAQEAAVLPASGLTALQALRDQAKVRAGQRVLVIGASGGVGTYAVQIGVALGAEVTGVCSAAKADLVRSLGATTVIDHAREQIGDSGVRYDAVIDIAGNRPLRELRRVLVPGGRLVIVGGEGGGRLLGGIDRQLRAALWSPFSRKKMTMFVSRTTTANLDALRELVESGAVRPALGATYGLDEAATAIADMAAGRLRGKAAIRVVPVVS